MSLPVWVQIVFGILSALGTAITIGLTVYVIKIGRTKSDVKDRLELEARLVRLETTTATLDDYMSDILLTNIKKR